MAKEEIGVADIVPGLIVRHTNRRLGNMAQCEACEQLVSGGISFTEFVDQVGEGYGELLDFMMENDLHPGRPEEVLFCIDCHAEIPDRVVLRSQLEDIHSFHGQSLMAREAG